jgi:hypothetical protein
MLIFEKCRFLGSLIYCSYFHQRKICLLEENGGVFRRMFLACQEFVFASYFSTYEDLLSCTSFITSSCHKSGVKKLSHFHLVSGSPSIHSNLGVLTLLIRE